MNEIKAKMKNLNDDCYTTQFMKYLNSIILFLKLFLDGEPVNHDLLKAIEVPFRDEQHIAFGPGMDEFPAFVLSTGHDIKIPHKLLLPDKLYTNFSLRVTVKPESVQGEFRDLKK